jgi:hypothetical protein
MSVAALGQVLSLAEVAPLGSVLPGVLLTADGIVVTAFACFPPPLRLVHRPIQHLSAAHGLEPLTEQGKGPARWDEGGEAGEEGSKPQAIKTVRNVLWTPRANAATCQNNGNSECTPIFMPLLQHSRPTLGLTPSHKGPIGSSATFLPTRRSGRGGC